MAAARKMDELLVSWLGSDAVYESIMELIDNHKAAAKLQEGGDTPATAVLNNNTGSSNSGQNNPNNEQLYIQTKESQEDLSTESVDSQSSPRGVIPPFYPLSQSGQPRRRRRTSPRQHDSWDPLQDDPSNGQENNNEMMVLDGGDSATTASSNAQTPRQIPTMCVRDHAQLIYEEAGQDPPLTSPSSLGEQDDPESPQSVLRRKYMLPDAFCRITKDVCRFPSFFNMPLYSRILDLWNEQQQHQAPMEVVTYDMFEWYWKQEMEPYDTSDRFYRLVKQPDHDYIERDDFLPFIKALLSDHPGLEFLSSHAEFQEKYAVTVITRIFYAVNKCHSGRITSRQIRRSDLLEAFHQVDEEEDINKVTRYLSYEHFYVLYCRFWELDHDRDYRISREDLLKYGDHSLSHMIVDRIFDAAPRPFEQENPNRDYLTYESFIYFMLSEEDKSNEVSVRYWFTCVDVDGDGKLNNMEMRSFYAVQLHRMQCMGHEIVPFEDMLCQMMDMIKPANTDYFVVEDFLQPECCQVSGALFDALFNLNKYLLFEQRDPFVERQKREDEFECDWDRFACIDYNRLAMEEEAREEEAMEIDWVTVDEDEEGAGGSEAFAAHSGADAVGANVSEAPF